MERLLLSPSEVAALLGIGRSRVYEFLAAGILPSIRMGRSIRIPASSLREWIDRRASENPSVGRGDGHAMAVAVETHDQTQEAHRRRER